MHLFESLYVISSLYLKSYIRVHKYENWQVKLQLEFDFFFFDKLNFVYKLFLIRIESLLL